MQAGVSDVKASVGPRQTGSRKAASAERRPLLQEGLGAREGQGEQLEPEARQRPLQPKSQTSKAKAPASVAHLSLLQEEPLLDAWEDFVYTRLAGQSPSYPAKCEPLCQRENSIKTPK